MQDVLEDESSCTRAVLLQRHTCPMPKPRPKLTVQDVLEEAVRAPHVWLNGYTQLRPEPQVAVQDVLEEEERAMLLAARHRPNAALQVLSQVIACADPREGRVRRQLD